MRIIAGQNRGVALASVGKGDAGAHLRPTTDRVRESLFNVLMGGKLGDPVTGAHVLDLFAGTGALGLEALSRGAKSCIFVDDGRKSLVLLRQNIKITKQSAAATVIARDTTRLPAHDKDACDLVFLDPPYGKGLGQKALLAARDGGWLAPKALVVFEENASQDAPDGFDLLDQRRYGDTHVSFMEFSC